MEKSKVYYTNLRCKPGVNLLQKLKKLVLAANIKDIDFNNKFVAIKIHFGEPGNLSYIRSNYTKVIVDLVKELNGYPFLTDCNTLYVGRRKNALEHIDVAYENGFSPFQTNANVIIADGLKGNDESIIDINLEYVKKAKIGRAINDADIIISMNHFKGHEATGFGGAIKNLGMGSGSRSGKMEMHRTGKPVIDHNKCVSCKNCIKYCAHNAIYFNLNKANINHEKCVGCGRCIGVCNFEAINMLNSESNDILNKKIAEYAYAVIKDKPNFHINFLMNISPNCDCHSENDAAIVPDIGILASYDPVALDKASVDLVNKEEVIKNTYVKKVLDNDIFTSCHPKTNWQSQIEHGCKINLGNKDYELIEVK